MARKAIAIGATTDQIKILHTIPQAVGQVCDETAVQIESTASQVIEDAQVVATKLRELALAVREHGRIATEHVTNYCGKSKHALDTISRLQADLSNDAPIAIDARIIDGVTHLPDAPQLDIE